MNVTQLNLAKDKLQHELSREEQEALRRCVATTVLYGRIGAFTGISVGLFGMYRSNQWPLRKHWGKAIFYSVCGLYVGVQVSLIAARMKTMRIIHDLPNPDHLMKALREVQVGLQDARRRPLKGGREWSQRTEGDERGPMDGGFGQKTLNDGEQQAQTMSTFDQPSNAQMRDTVFNESGSFGQDSQQQQQQQQQKNAPGSQKQQSQNIWQQIRSENAQRPETAWDRLRKTGSTAAASTAPKSDDPFATTSPSSPFDEPARPTPSDFGKAQDRDRDQNAFDLLLERERQGEAEDAARTRNKFGDYN